jgi:methyl-accepting chemotaxis protein
MIMTISKKLHLLIVSVLLGLAILTGISVYQIDRVNRAASYATVKTVPSILTIQDASDAAYSIRVALWKYIADADPAVRSSTEKAMSAAHVKVIEALNKYEKENIADKNDAELLRAARETFAVYEKQREIVMAVAAAGKIEEAMNSMLASQGAVDKMMNAFAEQKKYNEKLGKQGAETATATMQNANILAVLVSVIVALVVAITGLMLSRKIVRSLLEAVNVAKAVADGNLTMNIRVTSKDEIGQLMQAIDQMNSSLVAIVSDVRLSVNTITAASSGIASGNMNLSVRTEQQAGSLEETASAMEELTSTVKQNADNARQANQLAVSASEVATEGGNVVSQVITTMDTINTSSRKIVDIISVIDGIAFQTNILALNAAVEAARAGEQGRGFAVVASEVRNLAQRSATAAKEIKTLIDDSVSTVENGSNLVAQAGATMEQVVTSVRRVTDIVGEISSASAEQSSGIEQVNQAITSMDQATQQNGALVEQAAAAAQSLRDQAQHLEKTVSVFKLDPERVAATGFAHAAAPTTPTAAIRKATVDITPKPAPIQKNTAPKPALPKSSAQKDIAGKDGSGSWEEF